MINGSGEPSEMVTLNLSLGKHLVATMNSGFRLAKPNTTACNR